MNMNEFLACYGYRTASLIIRELAYAACLPEQKEDRRKEAIELANRLEEALKSLEGKQLP